jgi:hypothetical protein
MASGWFGLAGVALGGFLTAGLTYLLDWRRRIRDAAMARRLVSSDLMTIERALKDAEDSLGRFQRHQTEAPAEDQQWPVGWERQTWAESWAGYRQALAVTMATDEFRPLATAFGFIEQFQHSLAAGRRPFQSDDAVFLEDVRKAVDEARAVVPG